MKKFVSLLVVALLMLTLTACGQDKSDGSKTIEKGSPETASTGEQKSTSPENQTSDVGEGEEPETPNGIPPTEVVEITPEVPDVHYEYSDGMGRFYYNGIGYGYLDGDGKVVIEPKYKNATLFSEGHAAAMTQDDQLVILDKQGKEVFKSEKYEISVNSDRFNEKAIRVWVKNEKRHAFIDTAGNELFIMKDQYASPQGVLSSGVIVWKRTMGDHDIMVTDNKGNQIPLPMKTGFASYSMLRMPTLNFTDNLLVVPNVDNTWNVIDKKGSKLFKEDFEELKQPSEGMIPFKKYNRWGYLDYQGNIVIEPEYEDANTFSNGLASVKVNGKIGFIDTKNNMVIEPQFQPEKEYITNNNFYRFDEKGFAVVRDNYGTVINKRGDAILSAGEPANVLYHGDGIICFITGQKAIKLYKLN